MAAEMALRNLPAVKQHLIISFWKASTIMAVSKFWSSFIVCYFGIKGIIKPILDSSWSFVNFF